MAQCNKKYSKEKHEQFIAELKKSMGLLSLAARKCNLHPYSISLWKKKYPKFCEDCDNVVNNEVGDFVESKLFQKINEGDTTAIIFYCKTKLKNRGYVERNELVGKDGEPLMKAKLLTKEQAKEFISEIEKEV